MTLRSAPSSSAPSSSSLSSSTATAPTDIVMLDARPSVGSRPRRWGCTNCPMRGHCFRWALVLGLNLGLTRNERREVDFSEKVGELEKELVCHGRTPSIPGRLPSATAGLQSRGGGGRRPTSLYDEAADIYSSADEDLAVV